MFDETWHPPGRMRWIFLPLPG